MYPNDQTVLENGIWRLWSLEIDEPYFTMAGWKGGWSGVKPEAARITRRPPPSRLLSSIAPDILMTELGKRADGFSRRHRRDQSNGPASCRCGSTTGTR